MESDDNMMRSFSDDSQDTEYSEFSPPKFSVKIPPSKKSDTGVQVGRGVLSMTGANVGSDEGEIVGVRVGKNVGSGVANAVGAFVGLPVGTELEVSVGASVSGTGPMTGARVGFAEAVVVGAGDGCALSMPVGLALGDSVASNVSNVLTVTRRMGERNCHWGTTLATSPRISNTKLLIRNPRSSPFNLS